MHDYRQLSACEHAEQAQERDIWADENTCTLRRSLACSYYVIPASYHWLASLGFCASTLEKLKASIRNLEKRVFVPLVRGSYYMIRTTYFCLSSPPHDNHGLRHPGRLREVTEPTLDRMDSHAAGPEIGHLALVGSHPERWHRRADEWRWQPRQLKSPLLMG